MCNISIIRRQGSKIPQTALEQQFRYAGPKPQTKEAAIVMLADSVEAASRSLDKPTHAKIELLVNRVVADKLRDGQLDESELTFRNISKIIDCFIRVIASSMHARIEYPDPVGAELKKSNNTNADTDNEQPETANQESKNQELGA